MPSLAELQTQFARALMTGEAPGNLFAGRVPVAEALAVHRGTIIGALTNALRLSCPSVDALVGADFFDQSCNVFARQNWPGAANLAAYGEGFAEFLADFAPTLPCLPDVARLDRAIETTLRAPPRRRRFVLDDTVAIDLPQSLCVLVLNHPADEIRAALDDDQALAAIDMAPAERFVLVWRKGDAAAVQRIDACAGRFLRTLLAGDSAEAAFQAAIAGASEAQALNAIQARIFTAAFCTVIQKGIAA